MKFNKIIKVSVIGLCGVLLANCGGKQEQVTQIPEFEVMTVNEQDALLDNVYPATLHGKNDVEIRPQISGFLTKVHVKEGQNVSRGQTLFTIDQVQLQAAVNSAQASVEVAKANVNTATTNCNNNKILFDKNIISASAYQTSVDQLNSAIAQLNAAEAQLTSARKNLSYTIVSAPTAGVVGTIDFKEGALVSQSTLLTILSDNSDIEAYFSFNEKDLLNFTNNGSKTLKQAIDEMPEVSLKLANGEIYPLKGKIVSISGVIDSSTGSATVKASFSNKSGMLRSGNTGQILIPNFTPGAIMIPQSATYEVQDIKFCYVLGDSCKVKSTAIEVSPLHDGKNYIITSGLKSGDVIVTEGVGISVKEGMIIKPKNTNTDTK